MKGSVYDVSHAHKGFSTNVVTAHEISGGNGVGAIKVADHNIDTTTNIMFISLLTAIIAITYLRPQIYCPREFYKNCFKNKCWWHPPRRWVFDVLWFLADAFTVVAMTHYLWTSGNPGSGTSSDYYIAIYSLFIGYLGSRYFWINSFWNYHSKKSLVDANGEKDVVSYTSEPALALSFAVFWAVMMVLLVTALVILFAVRHDWWAFGFMLAVWIWLLFILVWTAMVRSCLGCERPCGREPSCPLRGQKANGLF